MGVTVLHSADWHMGTPFSAFPEDQREFLRREQRKLPETIAEICRQERCELVLLAGDIFDGIPGREDVEAVKQALADCGVPVFVSPGNHDFCGPGSPWLEEAWPENVRIFTGGLESVALPGLDCRIYGAGYRSMDCGPLLEGFRAEGGETFHIGLFHGDPVTVQSPYCPVTAAQVQESALSYLALGHILRSGAFRAGETLCGWPGCPMGRGWDETGEKGVYLVTLGEETKIRFRPLDVPRFFDPEADISDGAEQALAQILPAGKSRDFFRITLTGQGSVDLQKLKKDYDRIPNLFFRDRTEPEADLWEEADSDSFRGVYFRLLQQQAPQNPAAQLAAEISRKILSGREVRLP